MIGLYSPKVSQNGEENVWGRIGRSFIKGVLNSACGLRPDNESEGAKAKRVLPNLARLDGIEFVARIGIDKDSYGLDKNTIDGAITAEHKSYVSVMGTSVVSQLAGTQAVGEDVQGVSRSYQPTATPARSAAPPPSDVPPWAR